jgi:hypothetical protein
VSGTIAIPATSQTGTKTLDLPALTSGTTATGTDAKPAPEQTVATGTTAPAVIAPGTPVTYAEVIPAIVKKFNLGSSGPDVTFTNISRTSALYPAFKAAYKAKFFGAGINPAGKVPCNIFFVLLGLSQGWNPPHTPATLFTAYAAEASARGQTYGCVA